MKKEYLFKEEEYKDKLKGLNFFCEVVNQHWEGLNSARPIIDEDLPYIGKLWTHFYDKLWKEYFPKVCEEFGLNIQYMNTYEYKDALAYVRGTLMSRLGGVKGATDMISTRLFQCGEGYGTFFHTSEYLTITDKGLVVNEKGLKEHFTIYITNSKQEKALKLAQEIAKNSNELLKLGLKFVSNYYWYGGFDEKEEYGIRGESIIEDLQGE